MIVLYVSEFHKRGGKKARAAPPTAIQFISKIHSWGRGISKHSSGALDNLDLGQIKSPFFLHIPQQALRSSQAKLLSFAQILQHEGGREGEKERREGERILK